MTLAAGSRLGPYEILAPLGAGGMGEVWRARDPRLGREVAIKVLPSSLSADADRLRRFEQEARAAGLLNHPNITAVYDVGQQQGVPYVVEELLEGETLRSVLTAGRLPPRRATEYALQIAHGLAAAHQKGIVHRDLKPENLFVTTDGRIKILDFGLAKLVRPDAGGAAHTDISTEPGFVLGTIGYMAPEQVRGQPADARSDTFTLGVILYEMLTGTRAFRGGSAADTMSAILKDDPPDLTTVGASISPALERLVRHSLEKSPDQRFQSARDLAFGLESLPELGTAPRPAGSLSAPPRRPGRRAAAAAALALLALAASFVAGRASRSAPRSQAITFERKTFRPQVIFVARFAPDGRTIVYSSAREGNRSQIFAIRPEYPEPSALGLPLTHLLSVSTSGELLLLTKARWINHRFFTGTLARMSLGAGAPREVVENVREADWSPDGERFAIVHEVDAKDRLEYPAGTVLYQTGGYVSDVRVSPKGDRVAFFDHPIRYDDRGSVAVVDTAGHVTVLSSGYSAAEGLAWSPDGSEVLFSAGPTYAAFNVYAVTLAGKRRIALQSAGGLTVQDVSRDGRWLVTRDDLRTGFAVRAPGATAERDLSWLGNSLAPLLSRDGRALLFTDEGESAGANYFVCWRKTDGSPVVRLGEGRAAALSPDGSQAVAWVSTPAARLVLYPTGPGEAQQLDPGPLQSYESAAWFQDGRKLLVCGHEAGRAARCYVQPVSPGAPQPVTGEGVSFAQPSPDGSRLVARGPGRWLLSSISGGAATPLQLTDEDDVVRWSPDGRALWVRRKPDVPARIDRYGLDTGRREPIETIGPADSAGLLGIFSVSLADDPGLYAYNYWVATSQLFVAVPAQ